MRFEILAALLALVSSPLLAAWSASGAAQEDQKQQDSQTPQAQQGESGRQNQDQNPSQNSNQNPNQNQDQKKTDQKSPQGSDQKSDQKTADQGSSDQKADDQKASGDKDSGDWSSSSSTPGKEPVQDLPQYNPLPAEKDVDVGTFYMHKGNSDAAIARFQDAIQLKPDYAKPRLLLAEIYEKKDDKANAIKYYEDYLKVYPHAPDAKKIQGKIEKLKGR